MVKRDRRDKIQEEDNDDVASSEHDEDIDKVQQSK